MYCTHFGLQEKPFNITPNPKFVFMSPSHKEALAHLVYGINTRSGFISLTGEVGTGKTTLIRTILSGLSKNHKVALIFNPCYSGIELLSAICEELGIFVPENSNIRSYYSTLNNFLIQEQMRVNNVVVIIDEAQNLPTEVLEQLRMISNLETESSKLIQIILVGQPELDSMLNRHDLRQLKQRILVKCTLKAMTLEESSRYIIHRIKISGARQPNIFTQKAIKQIYKHSKGIPRLINVACDHALLLAWTKGVKVVNLDIAKEVINAQSPKMSFFRKILIL